MKSSWRLKAGNRPDDGPGGRYDGTFSADYEYVEDLGDLDECNGRFGVTPEYPDGTYYYVITEDFPVIPRCFKGRPDKSFTIGPPPAGCSTSDGASFCATLTSVTEDPAVVRSLINVYPSPTTGVVRFDVQDAELILHLNNIAVLDAQGRTLVTQPGLNDIDLSNASAGTYYIRFNFDGTSVVKPLIKQ